MAVFKHVLFGASASSTLKVLVRCWGSFLGNDTVYSSLIHAHTDKLYQDRKENNPLLSHTGGPPVKYEERGKRKVRPQSTLGKVHEWVKSAFRFFCISLSCTFWLVLNSVTILRNSHEVFSVQTPNFLPTQAHPWLQSLQIILPDTEFNRADPLSLGLLVLGWKWVGLVQTKWVQEQQDGLISNLV